MCRIVLYNNKIVLYNNNIYIIIILPSIPPHHSFHICHRLNVAKWQSGKVALLPGLGWLRQVIHKHRRQLLRAAAWDKGE